MSLIFPRLARNFIKHGYFPTDEVTLSRILSALDCSATHIRMLDPCCGEGTALAEFQHHCRELGTTVESYGIEIDQERAQHAKSLLGMVARADHNDVLLTARSMSFLFLNPPYGDVVKDGAGLSNSTVRERHEKLFCRRHFQSVQFGGVMVLIVPFYVLDEELSVMIARNFNQVRVYLAPEQRFKQAVIFGVKQRAMFPDMTVTKHLQAFGKGEHHETLPEVWPHMPYAIPDTRLSDEFSFRLIPLDVEQLSEALAMTRTTLWSDFGRFFGSVQQDTLRPLCQPSEWHVALMLAAGQVSGVVRNAVGEVLLVKGDTYKAKKDRLEQVADEDGEIRTTRISTDVFVPNIKAINFTPGHKLGQIINVR